jgi:hypothetical protein
MPWTARPTPAPVVHDHAPRPPRPRPRRSRRAPSTRGVRRSRVPSTLSVPRRTEACGRCTSPTNAARSPGDVAAHLAELGLSGRPRRRRHQLAGRRRRCSPSSCPTGPRCSWSVPRRSAQRSRRSDSRPSTRRTARPRSSGPRSPAALRDTRRGVHRAASGRGVGGVQRRPDTAERARAVARQRVPGGGPAYRDPARAAGGGKPAPALMQTARDGSGRRRRSWSATASTPDIQGGRAAEMATLLVLTGVSDATELLTAPAEARPDYVGADLGALDLDPDTLAVGPRPGWTVDGGPERARPFGVRGRAGRAAHAVCPKLGHRWRAASVRARATTRPPRCACWGSLPHRRDRLGYRGRSRDRSAAS